MYHDLLLIATHLGVDIKPIQIAFIEHPQTYFNEYPGRYASVSDLLNLKLLSEAKKPARVCTDALYFNHSLATKSFGDTCRFMYYVDDPEYTIDQLVNGYQYSCEGAVNFIAFRLQRLVSMYKHSPGLGLFTRDTIGTPEINNRITESLKLKSPLSIRCEERVPMESGVPKECIAHVKKLYDKYLSKMTHLPASVSLVAQ